MTTEIRLARDLPEILGDLAMGPYPDYIEDVLADSARVRQRPAWTFVERWLPMVDLVRQPAFVPRLPWRTLALVMLMVALLLAAAVFIGGQQQRVPAPFGPARNGQIAYDAGGDIYTADPVTGSATAIVSGPKQDRAPRFSLDGRQIAFERKLDAFRSEIYVVRTDGTQLRRVTPEPVQLVRGDGGRAWLRYDFSPDGKTLLISTTSGAYSQIAVAQIDGSVVSTLDVGMSAVEPSFRPPDGAEILFIGDSPDARGLFAVDVGSGKVRSIVTLTPEYELAGASWSPDGSKIAYWMWGGPGDGPARTHVVRADGTGDAELPSPPGSVWNAHATWSNDGTRIFVARAYSSESDDVRGAVQPADGRGTGIEIASDVETVCCAAWMWSPDDTKIFGRPAGVAAQPTPLILDAAGGPVRPAPWRSVSDPTWQRLAP